MRRIVKAAGLRLLMVPALMCATIPAIAQTDWSADPPLESVATWRRCAGGLGVTRVDIYGYQTVVHMDWLRDDCGVHVQPPLHPDSFRLHSLDGQVSFNLVDALDVPIAPETGCARPEQPFRLVFEALPVDLRRFHIIEGQGGTVPEGGLFGRVRELWSCPDIDLDRPRPDPRGSGSP